MTYRLDLTILLAVFCLVTAAECSAQESEPAEKPDADSMQGKEPGQVRNDNGLTMKMVWCSPGFLTMEQVETVKRVNDPAPAKDRPTNDEDDDFDAPDEAVPVQSDELPEWENKITPVRVFVTRGYWLGKYEVSQSEWMQVMKTEPWKDQDFTKEGDDFPATHVNWRESIEFCRRFTELERKAGRLPDDWEYTLPTEAQWERACRARTKTRFTFGDGETKLSEYAWYRGNAAEAGDNFAHRIGQKKPNPWGLYDMHGNVYEWCRDWFTGKLPGGRDPETTEKNSAMGSSHVCRGGCWSVNSNYCRSASRGGAAGRNPFVGFRVALSPIGKAIPRPAPTPDASESK